MANPTYILFGENFSTVIMSSSAQLDGNVIAGTAVPTVANGVMEFPAQAANVGRISHDGLVQIRQIAYLAGGGTLTVTKNLKSNDSVVSTIVSGDFNTPFYLQTHEYLKFVTVGATTPKVSVMGIAVTPSIPGRGL